MKIYQSYDPETGKIRSTFGIEPYMVRYYENDGEILIDGDGDANTHFVDIAASPPEIKARPEMRVAQSRREIIADGSDSLVLEGLPVPCEVSVVGREYRVEDGVLEWSTLLPGKYSVRVSAFPFLDWESEVTAIEGGSSAE